MIRQMTNITGGDYMQGPRSAFNKATAHGFKTTEFWLAAVGILAPVLLPMLDAAVLSGQRAVEGVHAVWGAIAGGAIAGAYAIGRSIIKMKIVEHTGPVVANDTVREFESALSEDDETRRSRLMREAAERAGLAPPSVRPTPPFRGGGI